MNHLFRLTSVLLLLAMTSACATMNKEECETADWRALGFEDGSQGLQLEQLRKRMEACSKHGLEVSDNEYQIGYAEGIAEFCTPLGGLEAGEAGKQYNAVCPATTEADFLAAYEKGKEYHDMKSRHERAHDDYWDLVEEIDENSAEIADMKEELDSISDCDEYNKQVKEINRLVSENNKKRRSLSRHRSSAESAERRFNRFNGPYQDWRARVVEAQLAAEQ